MFTYRVREAGVEVREVGTGSTPTASHPSDLLKDTTELHPGNFIFYGQHTDHTHKEEHKMLILVGKACDQTND